MDYYEGFKRKSGFYLGAEYDSQLEGQWARFFHLALTFRGFRRCTINGGDYFGLNYGLKYRPDFYLPDIHFFNSEQVGAYVEVKPKEPNEKTMEKMTGLCRALNRDMILVIGSPINTQINNVSDDNYLSAWIINECGCASKNNRFIESIDYNRAPTNYIASYRQDGVFIKNNYVEEAERAGRFRFDENGAAILNDDYIYGVPIKLPTGTEEYTDEDLWF